MSIPLEDSFADILGKAQRGLAISDSALAQRSEIDAQKIRQLRDGKFDEAALMRVAPVLGLNASAQVDLAKGEWQPAEIQLDGLAQFTTHYSDMLVNAYLIWDPDSKDAAAFDTGADCSGMLKLAKQKNLNIKLILLTHAHPDHIADLSHLQKETGAPVYISTRESASGAEGIEEGKHFQLGKIEIESRLTWGHSPGGMTFVANRLARPVAIVGDALFAGSMGGGNVSYDDALKTNRYKIFTLPNETIICPGHGPMTTVGEERKQNAFFAR